MAKNWQDYPHIVALVGELNKWKEDFQIVEYSEADEAGYYQSGRIEGADSAKCPPNWQTQKELN